MNDYQLETVAILAKLMRKVHLYNVPLLGKVPAVPLTEISKMLEQFTTTKTKDTKSIQEQEGSHE